MLSIVVEFKVLFDKALAVAALPFKLPLN